MAVSGDLALTFSEKMRGKMGDGAIKQPPSREEVYGLLDTLIEAHHSLSTRVKELEEREYTGVHVEGREYTRGQFVTHKGGVWHCDRKTVQRPGDGNDWTLAVKAGRNGRDAARHDD